MLASISAQAEPAVYDTNDPYILMGLAYLRDELHRNMELVRQGVNPKDLIERPNPQNGVNPNFCRNDSNDCVRTRSAD